MPARAFWRQRTGCFPFQQQFLLTSWCSAQRVVIIILLVLASNETKGITFGLSSEDWVPGNEAVRTEDEEAVLQSVYLWHYSAQQIPGEVLAWSRWCVIYYKYREGLDKSVATQKLCRGEEIDTHTTTLGITWNDSCQQRTVS